MLRLAVFCVISFAVIISCMGQTFQYSRGWTNGKRSSSHMHENPAISEMFEAQESERHLEKCIIQLQRLIHNPYLIRQSYSSNPNDGILFSNGNDGVSNNNRHQSNEIFDNSASASGEFLTKHYN
ncbi:pro-corazonin-like [Eupeodes corollae]|uniref:pro-corazonin-like n=1 Tax=Eupeodes corollae TaxID=290404 RepID=UPI002493313D|nr:pro-corazonin-like [Eupeodes corollae]